MIRQADRARIAEARPLTLDERVERGMEDEWIANVPAGEPRLTGLQFVAVVGCSEGAARDRYRVLGLVWA